MGDGIRREDDCRRARVSGVRTLSRVERGRVIPYRNRYRRASVGVLGVRGRSNLSAWK